ncbi:MAG: hypothetical protein FWD78_12655 [Treponema sp.]|nr:hypothetical protein [Treponema sp.]
MEKMLFVIVISLIFISCTINPDDNNPDGNIVIKNAQLYTYTVNNISYKGANLTKYQGNGSEQIITGYMLGYTPGEINTIGIIGNISADGKLNITLPKNIDESLLDDISIETEISGTRAGMFGTKPLYIELADNNNDIYGLEYYNKSFSYEGLQFFKGWNLKFLDGGIGPKEAKNFSEYKWVIEEVDF